MIASNMNIPSESELAVGLTYQSTHKNPSTVELFNFIITDNYFEYIYKRYMYATDDFGIHLLCLQVGAQNSISFSAPARGFHQ